MSSSLLNNPEPEVVDVEAEFRRLAEWWNRETMYLSNMNLMVEHPAYRQIIALGPPVVPILLRELASDPDWWFEALRQLTGANPVHPDHVGRLKAMATDWLAWGHQNGLMQ